MGRYRELILLVVVTAIVVAQFQPSQPKPRVPVESSSVSSEGWLELVVAGVSREALGSHREVEPEAAQPEAPQPAPVRPPLVLGPIPSGLALKERTYAPRYSVRRVSLEQTLKQVETNLGWGEFSKSNRPQHLEDHRVLSSRLSYGEYDVSFDQHGRAGQIWGNGLERYGTPILAAGDTAASVEELLGLPDSTELSHYGNARLWIYRYPGFTLTVNFGRHSDGTVKSFRLEVENFVSGFC